MPARFLVSFAFAFAPLLAHAADARVPDLPIEAYRLPNGLKVVLSRDPSVPRVTVDVAYHVGSKNERAGRTGFAHFFEHMMFRGTKNVPDYDQPLQEAGASSNASTSEEITNYHETVPSNYLERALYLEAERLGFLPSALDQKKFDTEREVVKNERRERYENVPYGLAEETLLAHVFPAGHPYSWSVIGSMKDLNRSSTKDLSRFFAEFYHPANATLCLVGDFDPSQAKAWIEKYFGPLAPGPKLAPIKVEPAPPVARRLTQTDRVQLPRVYWAWRTVDDDNPDAPALHLLASILGSGEASRLYRTLVMEDQIASEVNASSDTRAIDGLFTLDATTAPNHGVEEIEKVFKAQIERIQAGPPTAQEVQRAQAKFEKSTFAYLTSQLGRATILASGFAEHDDPAYYRRDFARYFLVTPADVQRVARRYLVPDKVVLVIQPAGKNDPESGAVDAGPPASTAEEPALPERSPGPGPDWSKLPGPSEPPAFRPPQIVRRRLSNGVDVWFTPWRTLPIVSVRLLIPVGTADDPSGKSGLAHLTANLLDKGTKTKTSTELAEALELLGTSPAVSATVDNTVLSFNVVARNLSPALALVGEMLTSPRFDPKDVELQRQLQLSDLLQGPDHTSWIAQRAFRTLLYGPKHPYGNPSEGFPETVKGLTSDDVRAFHKEKFAANHSILIVVGDVEPDALVATLESSLGSWKTTGPAPQARPPVETRAEPGVVYLVDKPGAVQSVVDVGRRWVGRDDPRYFATLIGNRILGADFLSRLNANLRERNGFTYGVYSIFLYRRTGSVWALNTPVRADSTAEALKEIQGELNGLTSSKPLTAEEMAVARDAEVRTFPDSFEDPSGIASQLQELALFGLPSDYLDTFLDRLKATTADKIQEVMAEVVDPDKRVILIVGDRKSVEPKLQELGFKQTRTVTLDSLSGSR
jgi:zinc protease